MDINNIMKTIVLGPPGTGKTTTLLNEVDKYLKNTDPNKIGFFSFTQKAAYEARDRAMKKFNFSEDDLPYFRTLHSLAFRRLGLKKEDVMQSKHYEDLGKKMNVRLDYHDYDNDQTGIFNTNNDILRIIQLAKLRNITPEQQFNLREHTQDVSLRDLLICHNELKSYKRQYNLIDFTDMITEFVKSDASPKFDVVFIDEAQDLSRIQWNMAKSIWDKTQDSFIAGDDDQAVFRWAGADVDSFITQKGRLLNLTQSYRVPRAVHDIAMNIVGRISNRIHKEWKPRVHEGSLSYYHDFQNIDMSKGEWLVLGRTRYMLNDLENVLYSRGLFYKNKFKKAYEQDLYDAVFDWESARKGKPINADQIARIASYMSPQHYQKEDIKYLDKDHFYSLEELYEKKGLHTKQVWYEAFDQAPEDRVRYIRRMRENGEELNKEPRILLSTIHGAKGGESQNVVLLTDLSRNTQTNYERNPDDENRLFYVGATRTKEHLHIVKPKDIYKSFRI
jgi:DNA helicase-2/ATP-dependent DNA helicase PcrA